MKRMAGGWVSFKQPCFYTGEDGRNAITSVYGERYMGDSSTTQGFGYIGLNGIIR